MRTAAGYAGERAKRAGNLSRLFRSLVILPLIAVFWLSLFSCI